MDRNVSQAATTSRSVGSSRTPARSARSRVRSKRPFMVETTSKPLAFRSAATPPPI
jgi:hypothetical protein